VSCFRFIRAERANFPISLMCRLLDVSRSGFHAWLGRAPCERRRRDDELVGRIRAIHARSQGTYGAPRVHAQLAHKGVRVSRKRVERLMRREGLSGLVKRKQGRTTIKVAGVRVADDLVERDFNPSHRDKLWVADITHIRTWQGWLYLAAVVDCYSRRCVGWSMADTLRAELVVEALEMAVARRRPNAGLVHHSDHGPQYVSLAFGQRCHDAGIDVSMGSKGDAYDNAVCESFFSSLKKEKINRRSWPTRREARTAVFEWIEGWYNPTRLHSTLGYVSPVAYEQLPIPRSQMKEAA
jgi:putative transposase